MPEQQTITSADIGVLDLTPKRAQATKSLFCSLCRKETPHICSVDKNREVVCTCACGKPVKFPLVAPAEFEKLVLAHNVDNASHGLVTREMVTAQDSEIDEVFKQMMGIK